MSDPLPSYRGGRAKLHVLSGRTANINEAHSSKEANATWVHGLFTFLYYSEKCLLLTLTGS